MRCRLFVLADAANVSQEGKLNIMGEFNIINSSSAPAQILGIVIVAAFELDAVDLIDSHRLEMRLVDADGGLVSTPSISNTAGGMTPSEPGVPERVIQIWQIPVMQLPTFGTYRLELWWDTVMVRDTDFFVRQIPGTAP